MNRLTGSINYGGFTGAQLAEKGIYLKLLATYVDQLDVHLPYLTVRETAKFAYENGTVQPSGGPGIHVIQCICHYCVFVVVVVCDCDSCWDSGDSNPLLPLFDFRIRAVMGDPMLEAEAANRVERVIKLLNLQGCADTVVGNDLLRGFSGGEKKRVTISEALVTNARLLCMDE